MFYRFANRTEAGQDLARRLRHLASVPDLIVLALPRGGLPIGLEVAKALHAPLDIFLVRKLGAPTHKEFAIGALAENGERFINHQAIHEMRISDLTVEQIAAQEQEEIQRRSKLYRGDNLIPEVRDRTVIIVDDGLATGATMKVSIQALRNQHPKKIIVAVPVGAVDTCEEIKQLADEFVCLVTPEHFHAVGLWYKRFPQLSDGDVIRTLEQAKAPQTENQRDL